MGKIKYSLGFLFDDDRTHVVLLLKNRPEKLAGLLNGVGGKIEPGETPAEAMRREFREEANLDITHWSEFAVIEDPNYDVHCFYACTGKTYMAMVKTMTDEPVGIYTVRELPDNTMSNIRWLIPLAIDEYLVDQKIKVLK